MRNVKVLKQKHAKNLLEIFHIAYCSQKYLPCLRLLTLIMLINEFFIYFQLIFSGEYTKAMNKDWHSTHFCCWQCDESLTGQR